MKVTHLFAGKPQPFGPKGAPSSIVKQKFDELHIELDGAVEDEQGNKKLHGGPEMALHQYSVTGYDILCEAFPEHASKMTVGSIGENISAPFMDEDSVFIGDVYQIGEVQIQVSSPRAPCAKINHRYDGRRIDQYILENGNTGWYYRVLQTGKLSTGDEVILEHREDHPFSVREIMFMSKPPHGFICDPIRMKYASELTVLAPEWRRKLSSQAKKLA